jgi:hypothetical protein
MLTEEEANKYFYYNKETGIVYYKDSDKQVGSLNKDGYLQVRFKGVNYIVHRLAWLLGTGEWPKLHIDHINGQRTDNRLVNLRDVTRCVNQQNKHTPQGAADLMGVTQLKDGTYQASINWDNKRRHLGIFKTAERAHEAYLKGKRKFHLSDPNSVIEGD